VTKSANLDDTILRYQNDLSQGNEGLPSPRQGRFSLHFISQNQAMFSQFITSKGKLRIQEPGFLTEQRKGKCGSQGSESEIRCPCHKKKQLTSKVVKTNHFFFH
jgi:hypothetical protein